MAGGSVPGTTMPSARYGAIELRPIMVMPGTE